MPQEQLTDEQLINEYVKEMQSRPLSDETIKVRRSYLAKAARDVGFRADDVRDLRREYRDWLMRPSIKSSGTRAVWITTLHCAYKFWNQEGYFQRVESPNGALVDFDPTDGMKKPKLDKGHPHPIPEEDLALALRNADRKTRCWLFLGAMCGLRCKEIALLARENIDENTMYLHLVHTKGEKPRDVPMPVEVLAELREYGLPETGRLWTETPAEVSRHGNDFLHFHGIKSTMHALRHRFGTVFYRTRKDAFRTADVMGHSSTEITRIYAAPDAEKDAEALVALRINEKAPTD